MGDEASRRFLEPVVAASTAGDPERLLARAVIGDLVDFERKAGSILKGRMRAARAARRESRQPPVGPWSTASGLAGVPHALAGRLGAAVRLDQSVVAVDWGGPGSGAAAPFTVRLASGELLAAAAVVLALPAPALARLAGSLPRAAGFAAFADLPHQDVAVVSLGYRRNAVTHPLDGFGIVAPPASGMAWRSVIFDSTLFAGRAPEGHVLLSAQVGGAGRAVAWADNDATLTARVHGELAGLLGIEGEPAVVAVDRWPQALPQMVAGHDAYLARAVATERDYPGVVLLGAWRDGLAVADVMRGGQCAAQRLHSVFDPVFPRLNPEV
jgi:oxygen-dependent protoporphyrinogen oxidase